MLRWKLGRQETTSEKRMLKQRHEGKLGKKVIVLQLLYCY